jgi:5'-nucleotidase / UDP-sugar diphosphatase
MKHPMRPGALFVATVLGTAIACGQIDTITIIHVNDTHSTLSPTGPRNASLRGSRGGIARAATLITSLEATNPNPIFLHAGDFSIGDLFYNLYFGVPELRILSSLGCKAMAVGNHEWDLTPATLTAALDSGFSTGGFPLLSANTILEDPSLKSLRKYIHPSVTVSAGGTRVGIFGLTTPAATMLSRPMPAVVDTPFRYAAARVESLMVAGCNVIICLSHLGFALDQTLAAMVPGINVVVGGHDHLTLSAPSAVGHGTDTTWIVQTGGFYRDVGMLRLKVEGRNVRFLDYALLPVDARIPEKKEIRRVVASLVKSIEKRYGGLYTRPIAVSKGFVKEVADSLIHRTEGTTPIGKLVTDAFRDLTHTQIAIEPGGSTAQPIYSGPVTPADLFRVVGYGFNTDNGLGYHLVRFDMRGSELLAGLAFGLSEIASDDEFYLQASGLRYTYDAKQVGTNRLVSVTVNRVPLDTGATYSVTANFFVKSFLDNLGFRYSNFHEFKGDTTEFFALRRYVEKYGTILPDGSVERSKDSHGAKFSPIRRKGADAAGEVTVYGRGPSGGKE